MTTETDEAQWVARNPLRRWRQAQGWSLGRMAIALGVSGQAVDKYEKGGMLPGFEVAVKMAGLMDTTAEDLLTQWNAWKAEVTG